MTDAIIQILSTAAKQSFNAEDPLHASIILEGLAEHLTPQNFWTITPIRDAIFGHACSTFYQANKKERPSKKTAKVYFLQDSGGLIKIGFSSDVQDRIKQIEPVAGKSLVLLGLLEGGSAREAELHKKFASHRQMGEWFRPAQELLKFIAENAIQEVAA